jgi:hypothetical protein
MRTFRRTFLGLFPGPKIGPEDHLGSLKMGAMFMLNTFMMREIVRTF